MILKEATLQGVVDGRITLAFRKWKRPTVKAGGTLMTSKGQLDILSVDEVSREEITLTHAKAAGFAALPDLLAELDKRDTGSIYRIGLRYRGADPRIALRNHAPTPDEIDQIRRRLERYDKASLVGPWTSATLDLIASRPATRAADLAAELGIEKDRFKTNVRKLKALGLTESLEVGYRLSRRGEAVISEQ